MTDQTQQTEAPDPDRIPGPFSVPDPTASTNQPPSPSSTPASVASTPSPDAGRSEEETLIWPPPNMLTRPAKSADELRHDYGRIHQEIHRARKYLYDWNRTGQHPTVVEVTVGSHHLMRQYLPPNMPELTTLDEHILALSEALRRVREVFVAGEVARLEAARKEKVEKAALKKEMFEKEALEKEALEKQTVEEETLKKAGVKKEPLEEEAFEKEALDEAALEKEALEEEELEKKALEKEVSEKEALKKNRKEKSGLRELSSKDKDSKSGDVGSARRQSKRKAEEKAESSVGESSGSNGKRSKRQKRS